MYFIWSHEHGQWWGKNKRGFTPAIRDAGVYGYADAVYTCQTSNTSGPGAAPNNVIVPVKEMREAYGAKFATDPMKPSPALLAKLGSVIMHSEEATSPDGHAFDVEAIKALMADVEIQDWLRGMANLALLPVKRVKS